MGHESEQVMAGRAALEVPPAPEAAGGRQEGRRWLARRTQRPVPLTTSPELLPPMPPPGYMTVRIGTDDAWSPSKTIRATVDVSAITNAEPIYWKTSDAGVITRGQILTVVGWRDLGMQERCVEAGREVGIREGGLRLELTA